MPNYKEASVSGAVFQHAYQIIIDNPYQGNPHITFLEEEVITLSDGKIVKVSVPGCSGDFKVDATFPLLHPETGQYLGEATHGQLQLMMYSLYMSLRAQVDAT